MGHSVYVVKCHICDKHSIYAQGKLMRSQCICKEINEKAKRKASNIVSMFFSQITNNFPKKFNPEQFKQDEEIAKTNARKCIVEYLEKENKDIDYWNIVLKEIDKL